MGQIEGLCMFDSTHIRAPTHFPWTNLVAGSTVLAGCYLVSQNNWLLFHNLVETFAAIVACAIFMLFWNARRFVDNGFFLLIGIACLFAGILDLLHAWSYHGVSVFPGALGDDSIQLKTAGRWMASFSFLVAPLLLRRRINAVVALGAYAGVFVLVVYCVFWNVMPDCYVPGHGMTRFEHLGRAISGTAFLAAAGLLISRRKELAPDVFRLLLASWLASAASEFASTTAVDFHGSLKVAAHLFELLSLYLIYKSFVEVGLSKPYDLVFRSLKQNEEASQRQQQLLEVVLDTVQTGIVACDADGVLSFFNRASREFHGLALEPIPADQWAEHYDLYQADGKSRLRTQDIALFRALRGEEVRDATMMIVPQDGPARTLVCDGRPLIDKAGRRTGAVVAMHDVTDQRSAEESLQWKTAFLEAQVNSCLDGILVVDNEGKRLLINQRLIDLFAVPRPILTDSDDEKLLQYVVSQVKDPRQFIERVRYLNQHLSETSRDVVEFKNGMVFDRYSSPVLGEGGQYYGRIWAFRDMTEQRRADEAMQKGLAETERVNRLMQGRETRIAALKLEVNALLAELGRGPSYRNGEDQQVRIAAAGISATPREGGTSCCDAASRKPAPPKAAIEYPVRDLGLEKPKVDVAFIPILCSAPLLYARTHGYFARNGLDVTLTPAPGGAESRICLRSVTPMRHT